MKKLVLFALAVLIGTNALAFGGGGHSRSSKRYQYGVDAIGTHVDPDHPIVQPDFRDCKEDETAIIGKCCRNNLVYTEGNSEKCCDQEGYELRQDGTCQAVNVVINFVQEGNNIFKFFYTTKENGQVAAGSWKLEYNIEDGTIRVTDYYEEDGVIKEYLWEASSLGQVENSPLYTGSGGHSWLDKLQQLFGVKSAWAAPVRPGTDSEYWHKIKTVEECIRKAGRWVNGRCECDCHDVESLSEETVTGERTCCSPVEKGEKYPYCSAVNEEGLCTHYSCCTAKERISAMGNRTAMQLCCEHNGSSDQRAAFAQYNIENADALIKRCCPVGSIVKKDGVEYCCDKENSSNKCVAKCPNYGVPGKKNANVCCKNGLALDSLGQYTKLDIENCDCPVQDSTLGDKVSGECCMNGFAWNEVLQNYTKSSASCCHDLRPWYYHLSAWTTEINYTKGYCCSEGFNSIKEHTVPECCESAGGVVDNGHCCKGEKDLWGPVENQRHSQTCCERIGKPIVCDARTTGVDYLKLAEAIYDAIPGVSSVIEIPAQLVVAVITWDWRELPIVSDIISIRKALTESEVGEVKCMPDMVSCCAELNGHVCKTFGEEICVSNEKAGCCPEGSKENEAGTACICEGNGQMIRVTDEKGEVGYSCCTRLIAVKDGLATCCDENLVPKGPENAQICCGEDQENINNKCVGACSDENVTEECCTVMGGTYAVDNETNEIECCVDEEIAANSGWLQRLFVSPAYAATTCYRACKPGYQRDEQNKCIAIEECESPMSWDDEKQKCMCPENVEPTEKDGKKYCCNNGGEWDPNSHNGNGEYDKVNIPVCDCYGTPAQNGYSGCCSGGYYDDGYNRRDVNGNTHWSFSGQNAKACPGQCSVGTYTGSGLNAACCDENGLDVVKDQLFGRSEFSKSAVCCSSNNYACVDDSNEATCKCCGEKAKYSTSNGEYCCGDETGYEYDSEDNHICQCCPQGYACREEKGDAAMCCDVNGTGKNVAGALDMINCGCPYTNKDNYDGPATDEPAQFKNDTCCLSTGYGYDATSEKYVLNLSCGCPDGGKFGDDGVTCCKNKQAYNSLKCDDKNDCYHDVIPAACGCPEEGAAKTENGGCCLNGMYNDPHIHSGYGEYNAEQCRACPNSWRDGLQGIYRKLVYVESDGHYACCTDDGREVTGRILNPVLTESDICACSANASEACCQGKGGRWVSDGSDEGTGICCAIGSNQGEDLDGNLEPLCCPKFLANALPYLSPLDNKQHYYCCRDDDVDVGPVFWVRPTYESIKCCSAGTHWSGVDPSKTKGDGECCVDGQEYVYVEYDDGAVGSCCPSGQVPDSASRCCVEGNIKKGKASDGTDAHLCCNEIRGSKTSSTPHLFSDTMGVCYYGCLTNAECTGFTWFGLANTYNNMCDLADHQCKEKQSLSLANLTVNLDGFDSGRISTSVISQMFELIRPQLTAVAGSDVKVVFDTKYQDPEFSHANGYVYCGDTKTIHINSLACNPSTEDGFYHCLAIIIHENVHRVDNILAPEVMDYKGLLARVYGGSLTEMHAWTEGGITELGHALRQCYNAEDYSLIDSDECFDAQEAMEQAEVVCPGCVTEQWARACFADTESNRWSNAGNVAADAPIRCTMEMNYLNSDMCQQKYIRDQYVKMRKGKYESLSSVKSKIRRLVDLQNAPTVAEAYNNGDFVTALGNAMWEYYTGSGRKLCTSEEDFVHNERLVASIEAILGDDAVAYGYAQRNSSLDSCAETGECDEADESIHCEEDHFDSLGDCATPEVFEENINNIPQNQIFFTS
ncbi:MAG: hypothetical protein II938_00950 [Alphaproteobacteria bacterium]|nr:hypothetical protein [Alphaproteobacteria bacterium]